MTINKKEFAAALATEMNITKKDAENVVDSFLSVFTDLLANGDTIKFTGFGQFGTRQIAERIALNPQDGSKIKVPAKIKPYFKAGKNLKEAL